MGCLEGEFYLLNCLRSGAWGDGKLNKGKSCILRTVPFLRLNLHLHRIE